MTVTKDDFNKIWASTSSVPTYTFSDTDYKNGWEFVGNLPPTRAMWDEIQRKNDEKMQLLYTNASFWVDSVGDLRTADAGVGTVYATKGYYTPNDGGNGFYIIRADAGDTDDGGSIIILDNGNAAELITDGTVNVKQFGAKGDGVTDDTTAIQTCLTNAYAKKNNVFIPVGTYNHTGLIIPCAALVDGNDGFVMTVTGADRKKTILNHVGSGVAIELKCVDEDGTVITLNPSIRGTNIGNFAIKGNNNTTVGLGLNTGTSINVKRLYIASMSNAVGIQVLTNEIWVCSFTNILISSSKKIFFF